MCCFFAMQPWKKNNNCTINVQCRSHSQRIQIKTWITYSTTMNFAERLQWTGILSKWTFTFVGGLEMLINGTLYPGINNLTNISRNVGGNLQAKKNEDNCVQVIFPSGSGVDFCVSKGMMSFVVALDTQYYNKTKGLLGTFNENKDDDFTLPNGTVLSPSITAKQIHYDFGLKCKFKVFHGFTSFPQWAVELCWTLTLV